jgi:hypothetical protein
MILKNDDNPGPAEISTAAQQEAPAPDDVTASNTVIYHGLERGKQIATIATDQDQAIN